MRAVVLVLLSRAETGPTKTNLY